MKCNFEYANKLCRSLLGNPNARWASEYVYSVLGWITYNKRVTPKQIRALENIQRRVFLIENQYDDDYMAEFGNNPFH